MSEAVASRKQALRAQVLARRDAMSAEEMSEAAEQIARHAIAEWRAATTVAAYLSIGTEPSTRGLIEAFVERGTMVLLPVINGDGLRWAEYGGPEHLANGPLGITEPTTPRHDANVLREANVILVPALAVDHDGNRLGRGKGYYDRALATVTAPLVAVVYDSELVDAVPSEPHDRQVDGTLRPSGLIAVAS